MLNFRNSFPAKSHPATTIIFCVLAVSLLVGVFGLTGAPVSAAAPGGTPGAPAGQGGAGQGSDKSLSNFLQRETRLLENFQHRYEVSDRVAAKVQAWIDKAQADGKDTAGLQAGLTAFNARVTAAKTYTDQAAALLAAHAGFDADGNVTDRTTARQTVMAIREAMRNAHKELVKAVPDLRHAINDYRKANQSQGDDQGQGQGQGQDEATESATP